MNKYVLYSKVAIIRERQIQQNKDKVDEAKKYNIKMDIVSEVERLKDLQKNEEMEYYKKDQRKKGALIIVDQIKAREEDRIKQKEKTLKERQELVKHMQKLEDDDRKKLELKKVEDDKIAKEVAEANANAIEARERRKREEKELEEKIDQYRMERARKEEEELAEKKRLQEEKEMETKKLREKQEKAKDKASELDSIRARRAYEEAERNARQREILELEIRVRFK